MPNITEQKRFVSINNRTTKSDLPESFWYSIAENSCDTSWKGIAMQKSPFQIVATQNLIQELKPKTIIEFGSFKGASALWLADIQSLSVEGGKVISIDIDFENIDQSVKNDDRIEFLQGDSNKIEEIFPKEKITDLLHPIVLIEDAHINSTGILDYFHDNIFTTGDYFIIEDTNIDYNNACYDVWRRTLDKKTCIEKLENLNNKIVKLTDWLKEKKDLYLIDTKYVDPFGITNASKNWNSVIKRF
ncbi:MAG TPA: cephalosporin hydroxylase [Rickettsia endosymbiont of Pyrocoelia pectoralis]|nr:cephalosporin hydroxylase [Rickettsia endosymbiont of Pyrocoelia pectoralis]